MHNTYSLAIQIRIWPRTESNRDASQRPGSVGFVGEICFGFTSEYICAFVFVDVIDQFRAAGQSQVCCLFGSHQTVACFKQKRMRYVALSS